MQLSNKVYVYRNGHWIWTGVTKSEYKELTWLFWNKFNGFGLQYTFFPPDLSRAYNMVWVIKGKII